MRKSKRKIILAKKLPFIRVKRKRIKNKVQERQKDIKFRKSFLAILLLSILLWLMLVSLVYFVDPESAFAIPFFFFLIFWVSFFTGVTLFANSRRGFLTAAGITVFALLRYLGIGNLINLLLIIGLTITIEVYIRKSSE